MTTTPDPDAVRRRIEQVGQIRGRVMDTLTRRTGTVLWPGLPPSSGAPPDLVQVEFDHERGIVRGVLPEHLLTDLEDPA